MTGPDWSGRALDWRVCPAEYQAVWYHDDDLADACWPPAFAWQVPDNVRSGMYAARLTAGDREDVISFYVRPAAGAHPAPLAVLVPTFTYTIYANFYHPGPRGRGGQRHHRGRGRERVPGRAPRTRPVPVLQAP